MSSLAVVDNPIIRDMKKRSLNETTSDLVSYILEMRKLAQKCDSDQKDDLRDIFEVVLVLLISLKQATNLGNFNFESIFKRHHEK